MKKNLIQTLYQIGSIKFGEFTLKSGKPSSIYLDLRQIVSYPSVLQQVSHELWETVKNCQFDLICGVPYTALPLATCMSLEHQIPMIMRRKEKKLYGTKQQIEGKFTPGQTCLIVEDVITTGSSILDTTSELEEAGLQVHDLAVLIDRQQGGKENLLRKQYKVHAVFNMEEILINLLESDLLGEKEKKIVHSFLQEQAHLSH